MGLRLGLWSFFYAQNRHALLFFSLLLLKGILTEDIFTWEIESHKASRFVFEMKETQQKKE